MLPKPGEHCFFRAADGRYLTSTQEVGFFLAQPEERASLRASFRASVQTYFGIEDAGEGRVFIRSAHGDYLCACPDRRIERAKSAAGWETFTVGEGDGGRLILRSFHGTFLGADVDRGSIALLESPPASPVALTAVDAFDPAIYRQMVRAVRAPGAPGSTEKVLWTFWDQGGDRMSPFYRLNVRVWHRRLGPDWRIEVLNLVAGDRNHVGSFIARDQLPASFAALSPVVQSDAVRLALLKAHGGVWMDPSNLLVASLDEVCWRALMDPAGPAIMAGFYNDAWGSDHLDRKDCFESWFIATRRDNPFVDHWHRVFVDYWTDRTASTESWAHPLFQSLDLSTFHRHGRDFRNYLIPHIAFRRIIEHDPHMKALWRHHTLLRPAGDEAFYLTQVTGWDPRDIHRKLIAERDDRLVNRLLELPLMKFTSSMSATLRKLSEADLLDPRHTLGRLYYHLLAGA